jgi:hypothetical protein
LFVQDFLLGWRLVYELSCSTIKAIAWVIKHLKNGLGVNIVALWQFLCALLE